MNHVQEKTKTVADPPPAVTVVRAMLWNWWVVAVSIVVFVAVGATAALVRTPTYTATSKLAVGRINITSPGALSGFALATEALATGYSRTVNALAVAKPVSTKTGISVKDVQSHVSATPIPESPVFKVEANAPNADQAVALANASSHALIHYTAKLNQENPDSTRLYAEYRAALGDRGQARRQLGIAVAKGGSHPDPAAEAEIELARTESKATSLRVEAIGKAYTESVQSQTATQLIQVISPATEASSDRRSTFLIYTFIGFIVGLLVGAGAAFYRETAH